MKRSNVLYVISKTWKYEKMILIILALQTLIGVCTPFISMYLPVAALEGISIMVS